MIDALTKISYKIWKKQEWPTPMDSVADYGTPWKCSLHLCHNYRPISLLSKKVMLKVVLKRLKILAEETVAEEQAKFRAGTSTREQIFNLRNP